jgi:hypothetical protein
MKKSILLLLSIFTFNLSIINCNAQWQQTSLDSVFVNSFAKSGSNIFAASNWGFHVSSNNGNTWDLRNTGLPNISISPLYIKGDSIFAGSGNFVSLSTNDGNNWTSVSNGLPTSYSYSITSLTIIGDTIYTGAYGPGVYYSLNYGGLWTQLNTGLTNLLVQNMTNCGSNLLAGTNGGGVYSYSTSGIYWIPSDLGITTTSISSLESRGNKIFAGTPDKGIFISTNNGDLWTAINNGIPANFEISAIAIKGDTILAGTTGAGVFYSFNNGSSWASTNGGLNGNKVITALAITESYIYAGCGYLWSGIGVTPSGVWRLPLNQVGIEEKNNYEGNIYVYPNPAIINLNIETPQISIIEILNLQGQIIKTINTVEKETSIDISSFAKGMYFVKVKTERGIAVKKFIKE